MTNICYDILTFLLKLLYIYLCFLFQALNIINKLLKILPPDKKATFVKEGIEIWFSKVVPTVMASVKTAAVKNAMAVETLEMLAEELIQFDYSNNPTWLVVLECIYTPHK